MARELFDYFFADRKVKKGFDIFSERPYFLIEVQDNGIGFGQNTPLKFLVSFKGFITTQNMLAPVLD